MNLKKSIFGLLFFGFVNSYAQEISKDSLVHSSDTTKLFAEVENPAQFPGGMADLMRFLSKNVKYPKAAKKAGVKGKVFVIFILDETGAVEKESVRVMSSDEIESTSLRGADLIENEECQQEAIRVVRSFPDWIPASHHGHPVKTRFVLPINFR